MYKQNQKDKDKVQNPETTAEQTTTATYQDEMRVYKFSFSKATETLVDNDIIIFTDSLNARTHSTLTPSGLEKSFPVMIDNFKKMIINLNMNQKWEIVPGGQLVLEKEGYTTAKRKFKDMLSPLIVMNKYNNIIFEFNRHKPFTDDMRLIYRFMINAFRDQSLADTTNKQTTINTIECVLSLFLGHAITCNNQDAINILITEYDVFLIKILSIEGKSICMPILRTIDLDDQEACSISLIDQGEDEFIRLLEYINFSHQAATVPNIQHIFISAYMAEFSRAINKLIQNKPFMEKFVLIDPIVMKFAIAQALSISSQIEIRTKLHKSISSDVSAKAEIERKTMNLLKFTKLCKETLANSAENPVTLGLQTALEHIQFLVPRGEKYKQIISEQNQKIQENTTTLTKQTIQEEVNEKRIAESLSKELILEETNKTLKKQLEELIKKQMELRISKNDQLASRYEKIEQLKKAKQELEEKLEISDKKQP